jgi:hypothetical protein
MLLFLAISIIIGIALISILITLQSNRLIKYDKWSDNLMTRYVIKDLFLACITMIIITFLIPSVIWFLGKKDRVVDEIVTNSTSIYPIDTQAYFNIVEINSKKYVAINTSADLKQLTQYDYSKVEIVETSRFTKPRCENISIYENYKLVYKNVVVQAVNNMFANIYLDKENATYLKSVIRIYVPKRTID